LGLCDLNATTASQKQIARAARDEIDRIIADHGVKMAAG
jgi:hypothetical protein